MSFVFIFLISLTQGFTEFLPVSSQGHVILITQMSDFDNLSLREINIILHFGSLVAILLYNLKDVFLLFFSIKSFFRPDLSSYAYLLHNLLISFLPLVFFSYLFLELLSFNFYESLGIIGISSIIFSLLLLIIDTNCLRINTIDKLSKRKAFIVGIFQSFALIPGASRAGTVITAMRLFGYTRRDCIFYSNLLSIPTITGAIVFLFIGGFDNDIGFQFNLDFFLLFILSFIFSLIFIHFLVSWVRKSSLTIFVIYRLIFGFGLIFYHYDFFNLF